MPELSQGYPILLRLQDKQVAVIGGGAVATRKVKHLLAAGARVLVISPAATDEILAWSGQGQIEFMQEAYRRDMLKEHMPLLVIAATDDAGVNQIVAQDAQRIRALCNVVNDSGADSDFSNMAVLDRAPLTIALSSNGASPALTRRLKQQLEQTIGAEYGILSEWLGELRQPLPDQLQSPAARRALYQRILDSDILALLRADQPESARQIFADIVKRELAT